MLNDGSKRLVDEDTNALLTYDDDYPYANITEKQRLYGKPRRGASVCKSEVKEAVTERDKQAIIDAQRAAGKYSAPTFDAGKAASAAAIKNCGPSVREQVEGGGELGGALGPQPGAQEEITKGQDLGAGVPPAHPPVTNPATGVITVDQAIDLKNKQLPSSSGTPPATTQNNTTIGNTNCPAGTGGLSSNSGSQLGGLNCDVRTGNTTFTLTAPK